VTQVGLKSDQSFGKGILKWNSRCGFWIVEYLCASGYLEKAGSPSLSNPVEKKLKTKPVAVT